MRNVLVLSLALAALPVAACNNSPPANPSGNLSGPSVPNAVPAAAVAPVAPALTTSQRQAMFNTFESFRPKEEQLQKQFRSQVLSALTPAHRTEVANLIGQMAVSENPDRRALAKQLDAMLASSERSQILSAHESFRTQSKALHEQLRKQLESQMPGGFSGPWHNHPDRGQTSKHQPDAGKILLRTLGEFGPMDRAGMGGPPPPPQ